MKKVLLQTVLLLFTLVSLQSQSDPVFLTLANKKITLSEFEWMYSKNLSGTGESGPTREEYLQTYIDYKLKVHEAEELGLDKNAAFNKELDDYRESLINEHIPIEYSEADLVREAYDRIQQDVSASHILVRMDSPEPRDTLAALMKTIQIRQRILDGELLEQVVEEISKDPAVQIHLGLNRFFTAFHMQYPLETAAYTTPVNDISEPIRSRLGYHIVLPHAKRPAFGKVQVAHILVNCPPDAEEPEVIRTRNRIGAAYREMVNGRSWEEVALEFSEDTVTAKSGGVLPPFGVGDMIPEFEYQAFRIPQLNMVSTPFRSPYGWHIVRLLERMEVGTFDEMKSFLTRQVRSEQRLQYHRDKNLARIVNAHGFRENNRTFELIRSRLDESMVNGTWSARSLEMENEILFRIGDRIVTINDFASFMEMNKDEAARIRAVGKFVDLRYEQFKYAIALQADREMVLNNHPEIQNLVSEYHDGLLIYELMDRQIWSRSMEDENGLQQFYEDRKSDYQWNERTDAFIVTCSKETPIRKVLKRSKKIQSGKLNESQLNDLFCESDSVSCITLSRVITEKGTYPQVDARQGKLGPGPVYSNEFTNGFVIINKVRPPEPKKLEEVKGELVADYQEFLEERWMDELRKKYPVKVNRDLLSDL